MIRVSILGEGRIRQGNAELVERWRRDAGEKMWIAINAPSKEEIEPLLEQRFGFHELAAEDCLSPNTLPKYDPFDGYDFFIFRSVDVDLRNHGTESMKLAAFLSDVLLVTVHQQARLDAVESVWSRLPADPRLLARGCDFLLYSIVDGLVDSHFPLLDSLDDCVDEIQEEIFSNASPGMLDELLHLKRDLNVLRRHSLPQRELLNQISRGDAKFVQREQLPYFRDAYDHMFRISESIDVERDSISGAMEAYLSAIANRTNEIMKVLTIFSAIMLPLTLIAGIYGMNFANEPELHWHFGYYYSLGLMGITAAVMLIWFRRRGWMGRPPDWKHRERGARREV